jgi:hypothetical protein
MRGGLAERYDALPPRRSSFRSVVQAGEIEQPLEKKAPRAHLAGIVIDSPSSGFVRMRKRPNAVRIGPMTEDNPVAMHCW